MLHSSTVTDYFGALRCYRCGNYIEEAALSKTGDEEHVYCRRCWAVMVKEAAHRRECEYTFISMQY
jgi:ribosomal protein L37E